MKTLVYSGGATLTFGSGRSRRHAVNGQPFEVDDDLAKILLRDPSVSDVADVPRETSTDAPATPSTGSGRRKASTGPKAPPKPGSFAELQQRGKVLGLKVVGVKKVDLEAAIAKAEKAGSGTSGTTSAPGAITLGDLPKGAIAGQT